MFVKNIGAKVIGFGSLVLLPGEAGVELPRGYDENHPVVQFYIEKGFLVVDETKAEAAPVVDEEASPESANAPAAARKKGKDTNSDNKE